MLHTRHFSLEEANELLESMKPQIEEMLRLKRHLDSLGYDVYHHQYFGGSGPNGTGSFPAEMDKLIEIIKQLSAEGIQIKGIDEGLIDFPHVRSNGEEVYLCWKTGEDDIKYWHRIPDGFAGRRSIEEL